MSQLNQAFETELRDDWAAVEKRLELIGSQVALSGREASSPFADAGKSAKDVVVEVQQALARIRVTSRGA